MFGYFLALRAITQKPLEYFLEHQEMLGIFMDLDEPMNVEQEVIYEDADYSNLMNLVTHMNDVSESLSLKNSVISIFFLACPSWFFFGNGSNDTLLLYR